MKIRLTGTADEIDIASAVLHAHEGLRIVAVSRPYPNRDNPEQLRVYLDVYLPPHRDLPEGIPDDDSAHPHRGIPTPQHERRRFPA